jgi:hypothetical protein
MGMSCPSLCYHLPHTILLYDFDKIWHWLSTRKCIQQIKFISRSPTCMRNRSTPVSVVARIHVERPRSQQANVQQGTMVSPSPPFPWAQSVPMYLRSDSGYWSIFFGSYSGWRDSWPLTLSSDEAKNARNSIQFVYSYFQVNSTGCGRMSK